MWNHGYLDGRGTLPEPAGLAGLPAAVAAKESSSSQPLRLCSALATVALSAGSALGAATGAVGPSFERGKPGDPERWPAWTGRCGGSKMSEIEVGIEVVVGEMKKPGEERRGVRQCHSCSSGRRG